MIASEIPRQQWIMRLRDILTGRRLRIFQDLLENDKLSYETVRDTLLASQNLTSEHYRKEFNKLEPDSEQKLHGLLFNGEDYFGQIAPARSCF